MDVVVFGAGSLGSLLGGLLARANDVTLVGREPHVAGIEESGLQVSGELEFTVYPDAATAPPAASDLALVAVKTHDTADAARALSGVDLDAALSLSNGMGNEETLAAELSCPVLAGTCTYGALLVEPGHVECTGVGEVVLGPRDGGASVLADDVGRAFEMTGAETTVVTDMPRRLWEKLAVNAGINATTALARVGNGALRSGPGNRIAREAAREVARVARAEGIVLEDEAAVDAVEHVANATAANTSSMHRDLREERRTEVDAINGYVVDRAGEHGLAAPVNDTLAGLVRTWERERGLR